MLSYLSKKAPAHAAPRPIKKIDISRIWGF